MGLMSIYEGATKQHRYNGCRPEADLWKLASHLSQRPFNYGWQRHVSFSHCRRELLRYTQKIHDATEFPLQGSSRICHPVGVPFVGSYPGIPPGPCKPKFRPTSDADRGWVACPVAGPRRRIRRQTLSEGILFLHKYDRVVPASPGRPLLRTIRRLVRTLPGAGDNRRRVRPETHDHID